MKKRCYHMNVLLVCSGGVSASIFMKKLKQMAEEKKIKFQLNACSLSSVTNTDILLLSPQVAYAKRQLQVYVEDEAHLIQINNFDYASLNTNNVLNEIMNIYTKDMGCK